MIRLLKILFLSLIIIACSQPKVDNYNRIIDQVTRVEIYFKNSNKRIELDTIQVENFKGILEQNFELGGQQQFTAEIQIDLYDKESKIAFLMITESGTNPFVNFSSDNLNFGFQLTYGIGRYLNEVKNNTRSN